ncbi:hypothetical protein [Luteococcus japonicus]|uniref:FHA domain-containing protein n=1 Tax=Luteococcus japonicus LSP_Lj1 TaxID=1255658 RepID=A0A1R4IYI2_9ACTN|nr:hypothetical protein [Luteococcus japonicus]SJN24941.1 hypothetical protein FM114_04500 [Luteococcus japonicus LSP_Lj1]
MSDEALVIDYIGELTRVQPGTVCTIGRTGMVEVDDNPYLHRTLLEVAHHGGLWWVSNVGSRLPVQLTDVDGRTRATLSPGARSALVSQRTLVTFQAGPTSYELELILPRAPLPGDEAPAVPAPGMETIGPPIFTDTQRLAILALAEPTLRRGGTGVGHVPSLAEAAARLGWAQTRFNRKLDNVCGKLEAAGVEGLRGGVGRLASNRRSTLVHHAVSTRLVTESELVLLDEEYDKNKITQS